MGATTDWHIIGNRVLLRGVKKKDGKIILAKSVADKARYTYTFFIEEVGEKVPTTLKKGSEVYIALPGLTQIEGVTDEEAKETFFFIDYNFIYLFKEPKKQ